MIRDNFVAVVFEPARLRVSILRNWNYFKAIVATDLSCFYRIACEIFAAAEA
jgi:hypothetical protein